MLAVRALALSFVASLAIAGPSLAAPQGGIPPVEYPEFIESWVDPVNGVDPVANSEIPLAGRVGDPDYPFKTLQSGIDRTYEALVASNPTGADDLQGVVYALPGIYGPANVASNGPHASGDAFPILMRDRVHVRGVGARRCVLRGVGIATGLYFWPNAPTDGTSASKEVLLDLSRVHPRGTTPLPPWYDPANPLEDTPEVFEGFTFEGGDIQVFAGTGGVVTLYPIEAIVSNCVFDMRNDWKVDPVAAPNVTMTGPSIGVLMVHHFVLFGGYVDIQLLLANNTFVMGRYGHDGWTELSLPGAVGVIDVSDPACSQIPFDCDEQLRGIGNPGLINNVFRTPPASYGTGRFAMLGIDASDTLTWLDNDPQTVQTNAFATSRVGATNGTFWSAPMITGIVTPGVSGYPDYWDCGGFMTQSPPTHVPPCQCADPTPDPACCPIIHSCTPAAHPTPRVPIFDTAPAGAQKDPGFVGEYLSSPAVGLTNYVDWRLLPSSPLKDQGYMPAGPAIGLLNGAIWDRDEVLPFNALAVDGEGYGNPRMVDGLPDIGADEIHFLTMAGSWSNDSNSHNQRGFLNPDGPPGQPTRYVLLPTNAGGVPIATGTYVKINGKRADAALPPPAPTGWYQPPATLASPVIEPTLPAGYRKKYIAFNNGANVPTPWAFTISNAAHKVTYSPIGGQVGALGEFFRLTIADDECTPAPCVHHYFNLQAVVRSDPGSTLDLLWSNLQAEYR